MRYLLTALLLATACTSPPSDSMQPDPGRNTTTVSPQPEANGSRPGRSPSNPTVAGAMPDADVPDAQPTPTTETDARVAQDGPQPLVTDSGTPPAPSPDASVPRDTTPDIHPDATPALPPPPRPCTNEGSYCVAGPSSSPVAGTCRSGNCCAGCWDGRECRQGSAKDACGTQGRACTLCLKQAQPPQPGTGPCEAIGNHIEYETTCNNSGACVRDTAVPALCCSSTSCGPVPR